MDLRPMTIGDILDYTFEEYRKNFKVLFCISAFLLAPFFLIINLLMIPVLNIATIKELQTAAGSEAASSLLVYVLVAMLVYFIYMLTVYPVMKGGIVQVVWNSMVCYTQTSFKEAMKIAWKKIGWLLLNLIMYGVLISMVSTVCQFIKGIIDIALIGAATYASYSTPAGGSSVISIVMLITVVFSLLFYIPIWVIEAIFRFCDHVTIIEKKTAFDAFTRSFKLSKKAIIRTITVSGLVWSAAMTGPMMVFFLFIILLSYQSPFTVASLILTEVVFILFFPLIHIASTVMYANMRVEKEGLDLEQRVDRILDEEKRRAVLMTMPDAEPNT